MGSAAGVTCSQNFQVTRLPWQPESNRAGCSDFRGRPSLPRSGDGDPEWLPDSRSDQKGLGLVRNQRQWWGFFHLLPQEARAWEGGYGLLSRALWPTTPALAALVRSVGLRCLPDAVTRIFSQMRWRRYL